MGDSRVGKSSIVKRFLFGEFNIKHIPTVEGNHLILIIAATTLFNEFSVAKRYLIDDFS